VAKSLLYTSKQHMVEVSWCYSVPSPR